MGAAIAAQLHAEVNICQWRVPAAFLRAAAAAAGDTVSSGKGLFQAPGALCSRKRARNHFFWGGPLRAKTKFEEERAVFLAFLLKALLTQNGPKISPKLWFVSSQSLSRGACRQWADVGWDQRQKYFSPGVCHHSPLLGSTSIHISWYHWPGSVGL